MRARHETGKEPPSEWTPSTFEALLMAALPLITLATLGILLGIEV